MQTLVDLLGSPRHTHGVLRHLQSTGSHTTGIDGLARCKQLAGSNELVDGIGRTTHVADLGNAQRFVGQYLVGIVAVQLVLCGTGQIDVGLLLPRLPALEEGGAVELFSVRLAYVVARGTQLQHVLNLLGIQSGRVVDVAVGTTDGDDLSAQLGGLLGCTPRHVAKARECNSLALDVKAVGLHHVVDEVQRTVARSLGTQYGAAPL